MDPDRGALARRRSGAWSGRFEISPFDNTTHEEVAGNRSQLEPGSKAGFLSRWIPTVWFATVAHRKDSHAIFPHALARPVTACACLGCVEAVPHFSVTSAACVQADVAHFLGSLPVLLCNSFAAMISSSFGFS